MSARGFGVAAGLDPEVARPVAARCAQLGFDSLWSNDHPQASGLETLTAFRAAAPELQLGVGVLALDRHQPERVRDDLERLHLAPERLWVGIGAGFSARPLGVVRDGISRLRELLPAGVRLAVAAMGPKMCALGGELGDGVFLNWMTPERAAWARQRVQEGATAAGRDSPAVIGYVRAAVGPDAARRLSKEESFYRELHPGYRRHFEALGAPPGSVGVAAADGDSARTALDRFEAVLDVVVVRALASATAESLTALAEATAPA